MWIFGILLLLTLIRRSVVTDQHLTSLQEIRDCIAEGSDIYKAIPRVSGFESEETHPIGFEKIKLQYYKLLPLKRYKLTEAKEERSLGPSRDEVAHYLWGELFNRPLYYGDLMENVCVINGLVIGVSLTWLVHVVWLGTQPLWPAALASLFVIWWVWSLQIILAWYRHTRENLLASENKTEEVSAAKLGKLEKNYLKTFEKRLGLLLESVLPSSQL
jgi:hypothetical protein